MKKYKYGKTVRLTEKTLQFLDAKGNFGETPDAVIQRLLGIRKPKETKEE